MKTIETPSDEIMFLEDLISEHYKKLLQRIKDGENIKLGDWLKMIELKRKLTPADAEQKKFWEKLDKIRKEELGALKNKTPITKKNRKKK